MATILVSIICIGLLIVGGITMAQGILTSADTAALSVEGISFREGDLNRTQLETVRAAYLSWADLLRVTVRNDGQTKLADFSKWDIIVHYSDNNSIAYAEWLPYTAGIPGDNEWQKARIGLNGPFEFFEPDILNPGEEMVLLTRLNPLPDIDTTGNVTLVSPNGIYDSISFSRLAYTLLTPHSENITIASTKYYELTEATPADGISTTFRVDFEQDEGGRKILYNMDEPSRPAKYVFPLVGIDEIPAATWTVCYRCYTWGEGQFPHQDNDVRFNIDIVIRQADGSIRETIGTEVAEAYIDADEEGIWVTKSATYSFPGYTMVDDNDYLEIAYYGETDLGPNVGPGYMQIRTDDDTLSLSEQTRIES